MSNELPWGIKNKVTVPDSARIAGTASFGNKGFYGPYFDQLLFELKCNHIWGTSTQVKAAEPKATFYTDGAGNPLDLNDAAVTITDDQKILINHDVTQTANLLLDAGGVKITIEMLEGVTLDMDTYDLTLGGSGDSVSGKIRITGTGILTIAESYGLRILHDTMTVVSLNGDTFINHIRPSELSSSVGIEELESFYVSATTIDVRIRSLKLLKSDNSSVVVGDISETFDITTDAHGAGESASTWFNAWLASNGAGGIERKLVPDVVGVTDSVTSFKLEDSTADFITDGIKAGDTVYNNNLSSKATILAVDDLNTLSLSNNIFTTADNYTIHLLSPTFSSGYDFKAFVKTAVYNDSVSNFDWFHNTDGEVTTTDLVAVNSGTATTPTKGDAGSIVPSEAIKIRGYCSTTRTSGASGQVSLTPTSSANDGRLVLGLSTSDAANDPTLHSYYALNLAISQSLYYDLVLGDSVDIRISQYSF